MTKSPFPRILWSADVWRLVQTRADQVVLEQRFEDTMGGTGWVQCHAARPSAEKGVSEAPVYAAALLDLYGMAWRKDEEDGS